MPVTLQPAPSNGHVALAPPRQPAAPSREHRTIGADAIHAAVRDGAVRAVTAVGIGAIAVIHAVDSVGKWTETRYVFWLYMALIAGCVVTGAAVLLHRSRGVLLAAAGLAASVLAGYVVDRTVGLPNATGDIGNWLEPLGLASVVVEVFVAAIAVAGFLAPGARRRA
jgi:hypothetical protein